jgi:hypothetical protein
LSNAGNNSTSEEHDAGNEILAKAAYSLFIGGISSFGALVGTMLGSGPHYKQVWVLLWCALLAIGGFAVMYAKRMALKWPPKGRGLRRAMIGSVIACIGVPLSAGFVYWLTDTALFGAGVGVAFLVGSVALFTVGMLIAFDKNAVDVSR